MDSRDEVIEIVRNIDALRLQLSERERQLDQLIGVQPETRARIVATNGTPMIPKGIARSAYELLRVANSCPMKARQIADQIGTKFSTTRSVLSRLARAGIIEKAGTVDGYRVRNGSEANAK